MSQGVRSGATIAGRWTIDERIGSGGMATVYAVTDPSGQRGALKMLHAQLSRDASTRARFLREGKVANAIDHPGVVRVQDDGITQDGNAYLVLELLEGETIEARRLRMGGALPLEEVLDTADMALDALAAAHEKQIVHRDVKPENFFLCHDGSVKLLDFGLARMKDTQGESTATGVTIGTPEFMPPEQAMGRRDAIDARSDVWGLGATMFNAITGEYVHDAPTLHEQLLASARQRARPIRTLAPFVPPPIAAVIDKALELEMSDRWQSAREMQDALRHAREDAARSTFSADSYTFPASALPASVPSSSDRTVQIQPDGFGERTLALDLAPVSSIPNTPTQRLTPGAQRTASPAYVAPPMAPVFHLPFEPGAPVSAVPQTLPVPGAAPPPARSSTRFVLLAVLLFVVSTSVGVIVAWRYLFAR